MEKNTSKFTNVRTTRILPKKSFLIGLGSILSLGGNYFSYKTSRSGIEADTEAIHNDWRMVGKDIMDVKNKIHSK
ncbi:hypothetical protein F0358_10520 [Empedobacter brevis]|uniref:hypothetical protein n=1 Tax=Empedobacter brevis TaxID=247 RepID=UPI00123CFC04|nr:hypothetical protein [Empedobacter brevis]QES93108.1 hypothetical protein F0358_10520 [Empedobacter brevis]